MNVLRFWNLPQMKKIIPRAIIFLFVSVFLYFFPLKIFLLLKIYRGSNDYIWVVGGGGSHLRPPQKWFFVCVVLCIWGVNVKLKNVITGAVYDFLRKKHLNINQYVMITFLEDLLSLAPVLVTCPRWQYLLLNLK